MLPELRKWLEDKVGLDTRKTAPAQEKCQGLCDRVWTGESVRCDTHHHFVSHVAMLWFAVPAAIKNEAFTTALEASKAFVKLSVSDADRSLPLGSVAMAGIVDGERLLWFDIHMRLCVVVHSLFHGHGHTTQELFALR